VVEAKLPPEETGMASWWGASRLRVALRRVWKVA
jgi:hypothetical protein